MQASLNIAMVITGLASNDITSTPISRKTHLELHCNPKSIPFYVCSSKAVEYDESHSGNDVSFKGSGNSG